MHKSSGYPTSNARHQSQLMNSLAPLVKFAKSTEFPTFTIRISLLTRTQPSKLTTLYPWLKTLLELTNLSRMLLLTLKTLDSMLFETKSRPTQLHSVVQTSSRDTHLALLLNQTLALVPSRTSRHWATLEWENKLQLNSVRTWTFKEDPSIVSQTKSALTSYI